MTEQEIFPNLTQEQLAFVRENLTPKFLQKDIQEYYGDTFTVDAYGCCLELKTNLSSNEILFEVVCNGQNMESLTKTITFGTS
mgnify:CR=1 FL=1